MHIELKRFKEFPERSDETIAFRADLFVDNMLVAYVSNTGKGACHMYVPAMSHDLRRTEDHARTLHPDSPEPLDAVVNDLIQDISLRNLCKNKTVFLTSHGDMFILDKPFCSFVKDQILESYSSVEEIINERYL